MGFVKTSQELRLISQNKAEFYDADMVFVFWLTRPEIVEHLLPPLLEPVGMPLVAAFIANYPRTSFGPPYKEGALFLLVQHEGIPGVYCLAMPVTSDMAMASGREFFGFPKKMAHIEFTHVDDSTRGYVERNGVRYFELEFKPDDQAVDEIYKSMLQQSLAFHQETGSNTYLYKSFHAPDDQLFDYPPRLVRQTTIFRPRTIEWGQARVKLAPSASDPWYELEMVNPIGAMRIVGDNTMLSGQVLAEVNPEAFAPYAFLKWDW